MAISDISLTAGMRSNLISLQKTVELLDRTQERLATGKKVNSPLDDPTNYFAAQALMQRASDLSILKDGMGQAIQTVEAADAGIEAIEALVESARGLAQAAYSAGSTERSDLASQFDDIRTQIDQMAADAGYKGTNLINGDDLTVNFNEGGTSSLTISGFTATTGGDLAIAAAANNWVADGDIDAAISDLDTATTTLRTNASTLAANLNVVTVREDFTQNMIDSLTEGADKLTLADMNEEGANMLMLQTQQALGTTALSLSAQAAQSVLRLF